MEGRQRHALVKQRWKMMSQEEKLPFVMMSRADEEKAKYLSKVAQIRNNLRQESKNWGNSMVSDVLIQLKKVIESEKDNDHESSCSEGLRDLVEESKDDLSLSLINQKIGSHESSQVLDEVVVPQKVDHFRQTQLQSYGFEK